jgi:hypothetical protein
MTPVAASAPSGDCVSLTFTASARRLGMVSAVGTALLGAVYAATLVAGLASVESSQQPIGDPLFTILEILIILMMPLMVGLMASESSATPASSRQWRCCWLSCSIERHRIRPPAQSGRSEPIHVAHEECCSRAAAHFDIACASGAVIAKDGRRAGRYRHDVRQREQEDQCHDRAILHERQQIGNEDAVPAWVLGEQAQGAEERSVVIVLRRSKRRLAGCVSARTLHQCTMNTGSVDV